MRENSIRRVVQCSEDRIGYARDYCYSAAALSDGHLKCAENVKLFFSFTERRRKRPVLVHRHQQPQLQLLVRLILLFLVGPILVPSLPLPLLLPCLHLVLHIVAFDVIRSAHTQTHIHTRIRLENSSTLSQERD